MIEPTETFSTDYYNAHGHLVCPNGDKLRSDDQGLFCWMEGQRIPAEVINGVVTVKIVIKDGASKDKKPGG